MRIGAELTTGQAAKLMGVERPAIQHWIDKGALEVVRLAGRTRQMISRESFRQLLVKRGRSTKAFDRSASEGEYLNGSDVARILGVTPSTVTGWFKDGVIPATIDKRRNGNISRKVSRADFDAFAGRNGFKPGEQFRLARPATRKRGRKARPRAESRDSSVFATQQEAARRCGFSQAFIARLVVKGVIPSVPVATVKGTVVNKIRRDDLERYVSAGCPRPKMGRPMGRGDHASNAG